MQRGLWYEELDAGAVQHGVVVAEVRRKSLMRLRSANAVGSLPSDVSSSRH
jgi:hypothetical protein